MSAVERLGLQREVQATEVSAAQAQTEEAFGFKWAKRDTYESPAVQEASRNWLLERYCGGDPSVLEDWLAGERKLIVDAGCGAGHSALLLFGERLRAHDYLGVDISSAVNVARQRFSERGIPGDFLRHDLATMPIPDESVDLMFSEGVLHHTDSTEVSVKALARKVRPGGRLAFYVYAKKAIIREFTDDHIRASLQDLSDSQAWSALIPLTKLGIALGELQTNIEVPEDIPFLGIKKGPLDLQRFFYWNICKLYYRPDWTLDEMNHINFDWFRPMNCHRQTPEQVRRWCEDIGFIVERFDLQDAGITVVALRPKKG